MKERFETFTLLLSKINRSIRKIKTEEMEEFNLKCPHVYCLYYLHKSANDIISYKNQKRHKLSGE